VWPRPSFDPLPEPAAPTPADYTAMQTLAAELLPADESAIDQAGLDLLALSAATDNGEAGMASLGLDVAAGAVELDAMVAEAELDTLVNEVSTAVQQDAALGTAGQGVDQSWPV
jgi:hypothetical protein